MTGSEQRQNPPEENVGHIDKWCLENCDPHLFRDLDKVSVSTESYLLVSYLCIIIML